MTCAAGIARFRLLDPLVGWDEVAPDGTKNLIALPNEEGLALAQTAPGAIDPNAVTPYLPPARLARGCDPCAWLLVTPSPSRLLVRDACSGGFTVVREHLHAAAAVAVWRHFIAVSEADVLRVFGNDGRRIVAEVPLHRPGPVAFTPHGEIVVVVGHRLLRVSLDGRVLGALPVKLPPHVVRVGVGRDCRVWALSEPKPGVFFLWSLGEHEPRAETPDALASAFPSLGDVREGQRGFCLGQCCYTWYGRCLDGDLDAFPSPAHAAMGQLLTLPIDSGIARCTWHRVSVDAVVPVGATLQISVATAEEPNDPAQGVNASEWAAFPAGVPHPDDWQNAAPGETDFLIRRAPGRYLYLRARLTGDGKATPILRRIRLDFPRLTSLDFLPLVYREEPEAEEFTERFLSIFDAAVEDADRVIERAPALLDPAGIPADVLPWLATFFDVVLERKWDAAQRRALLARIPELYMRRGTVEGLSDAIDAVFGVGALIEELGPTRSWGATGRTAVVGAVRLFSRSAVRLRLGTSRVGRTPLRSYGDPERDPDSIHAFRIRVSTPSTGRFGPVDAAELRRLVEAQKPAHVVASIVRTGELPIVGTRLSTDIDTILGSLPKPILGSSGNVRLRRASIVWHGAHGRQPAMRVGRLMAVGVNTIME